ncbi:GNAT family N-acetyltransferase [Clostridium magnum]|uniref:Putative acetyltransferase n=1 Tax=Clostridium magnum DSM 2767 TaxID=1121326 RepID=A0A162RBK0_9CLOT|nr:GNAT family N-acetyltransferase [Clostridium magnum]KZL89670.1 putative acetyltransferase [Clostridium magnum DSM 2767]SHH75906.1 Ribosomal protein S18 acetylase RimI [Clostridium magnum DSM 2767]
MENMVFVVRRATCEDVPQIKEISKDAFRIYAERAEITEFVSPLNESNQDVEKEIENKVVLVGLVDGVLVGSVRVEVKPDKTAYLSRFAVREEFQNRGIGKILMNAVDIAMKEEGVTNLYLHTASRMLSLVRFYYGRGFYIESTTKDRGYIRALLCKEYKNTAIEETITAGYEHVAIG